MDWKYKMYINGFYWKGYGGRPTAIQQDTEIRSFKRSECYTGGKIEISIEDVNK